MQQAPLRRAARRLLCVVRPLRQRNSGKAFSAAEVVPFELGAARELGSQKSRQ
jgi:hypothetical protein